MMTESVRSVRSMDSVQVLRIMNIAWGALHKSSSSVILCFSSDKYN